MATIKQVLHHKGGELHSITPDASVYEALEALARHDIGALPVIAHNEVVGIFSERDYARKVILHGKSSHKTAVNQLMTTVVFSVKPDSSVEQCMALMTEHHIRHLPVISGGRPIGIVSIGDIVKTIIAEQDSQLQDMHNYVSGNSY